MMELFILFLIDISFGFTIICLAINLINFLSQFDLNLFD